MIEDFERILAQGGGTEPLEATRYRLRREVESERTRRLQEIDRDFETCRLIEYGLTQERNSAPYGMAMGLVRWFRKKHPRDRLGEDLMRTLHREEYEQKRNGGDYGSNGRRTGSGNGGKTEVSAGLQAEEPAEGSRMEP